MMRGLERAQLAENCPPPPDRSSERQKYLSALHSLVFINSQNPNTHPPRKNPCWRVESAAQNKHHHLDLPHPHDHAPTLGSPTRICVNCPGIVVVVVAPVSHGARAPIPGPPGPTLAELIVSPVVVLLSPYGFGNEFSRCRPCVTMWPATAPEAEPEKDVAEVACCSCCRCPSAPSCTAAAGGECSSVMPGTETKYTEPVGSVPP
jgi:hypothetical protein